MPRRSGTPCLTPQSVRNCQIGVGSAGCPAPPPSEPDRRVSRIRLSGRWSYLKEDWQARRWAVARSNSPSSAKHPLFEGRQHAVGPDPQFSPEPLRSAPGRSVVVSSREHSLRFAFCVLVHPTSTFLDPFAPRALPRFPAPMGPLTPAGPLPPGCAACSVLAARGTRRKAWALESRSDPHCASSRVSPPGLPAGLHPSRHQAFRAFRLQPPLVAPGSVCFSPGLTAFSRRHLGLRPSLAGSPRRQAESSFLSCGLLVHLRLLPTSPRGDAVTFSYRVQTRPWRGLSPRRLGALGCALGWVLCTHA